MTNYDVLVIRRRAEVLGEYPVGATGLELGRVAGCDLVLPASLGVDRAWFLRPCRGSLVGFPVSQPGRLREVPVPYGVSVPLGNGMHFVRESRTREEPHTEGLDPGGIQGNSERYVVWVGDGPDARRLRLEQAPARVGSATHNELVLADRSVSGEHCRFEPTSAGLFVRDLNSRNGTWVDGLQVQRARVSDGTRIAVGRTTLRVQRVDRSGGSGDGHGAGETVLGPVFVSPAMVTVSGWMDRYARLSWPLLLLGESGTGKEVVAREIHRRGQKAQQPGLQQGSGRGVQAPFVAVNAGGMPATLIESELFGHEKGAFTGAAQARRGVFEQADGGTLFLDEIGELPMDLQSRLLRVLETWQVRRVGSEVDRTVRVKLVCATHRDLRRLVAEGKFRQDLYYRLARLVLTLPPLRERPEEIEPLVSRFLQDAQEEVGRKRAEENVLTLLKGHTWPGNVRELRNVVWLAAARSAGPCLGEAETRDAMAMLSGKHVGVEGRDDPVYLRAVLERHDGNMSAAARSLGMARTTLRDRLREGNRR